MTQPAPRDWQQSAARLRQDFVLNAVVEAKSLHREIREEVIQAAPELAPENGVNRRVVGAPGQRRGSLTLLRPTEETSRSRGTVWECRCDCGGTLFRSIVMLNRAARLGYDSACDTCRSETRRTRSEMRRALISEAYRRQFVDRRTLWLPWQTALLQKQVREDLIAAFGETEPPPIGAIEVDPCWQGVNARDKAAAKRKLFCWKHPNISMPDDDEEEVEPLTEDEHFAISELDEGDEEWWDDEGL